MDPKRAERPPVAIVATGAVLPSAPDCDSFWRLLIDGVDAAREPPAGRWALPPEIAFDGERGRSDRVYSKRACFVDEVPALEIDGIDPGWLERLDPSVGLALGAGVAAWREARTEELDVSRVGVVLGNIALPTEATSSISEWLLLRPYERRLRRGLGLPAGGERTACPEALNRWALTLPAAVLARALGLRGPHFVLDAACASSLFALERAVDELQRGRLDAVLAGGLSRPDALYTQMGFSQLLALSSSGQCTPFDRRADGLVVGEGAAVFVLKRLDDALRQGDRIRALVAGIGLSNDRDGKLLAPSQEGQLRAMRAAYREAGWRASDVDHVECHATGTPIGDRTEYGSLRELWHEERWRGGQCVLGAVKANVGHLLTGAGAAGVLKTVLALDHGALAPTPNFETAADGIDLGQGPFRVLSEPEEWPRREGRPRRAAVSGFGFGGTNAHVLLEGWQDGDPVLVDPSPVERGATPAIDIVGVGAHLGPWTDRESFAERVLGGEGPEVAPKRPFGGQSPPPAGWFIERLELALGRFRVPPRELLESLPQQVCMLSVAREALDDAGLLGADGRLDAQVGLSTGVFVGAVLDLATTDFHLRWALESRLTALFDEAGVRDADQRDRLREEVLSALSPPLDANRTVGALGGIVASRVAREFGIGGPAYVLSAEEASGLVALEAAMRALEAGRIEVAVVGAVDILGDPRSLLSVDRLVPWSPDGRALPFRCETTGAVPGEGAVALVLRRGESTDAYARLRAVATVTGAMGPRLQPEPATCAEAMEAAWRAAGVEPKAEDLLVLHGSGRSVEDRVELAAMRSFLGDGAWPAVSSAAGETGSTGAASGLASVAKAAIALGRRVRPGLGVGGERRAELSHRVPRQSSYWLRGGEGPRRAGVSSLSATGLYGHAVLEEGVARGRGLAAIPDETLFVISAASEAELGTRVAHLRRLAVALPEEQPEALIGLARRVWQETSAVESRSATVALMARSVEELSALLATALDGLETGRLVEVSERSAGRLFASPLQFGEGDGVAFVYPGSGNHRVGMGRELGVLFPELLERQEALWPRLDEQLRPQLAWHGERWQTDSDVAGWILAQSAYGSLVSDLLQTFGLRADAAIGYSLGETAALLSLGVWVDRESMTRRALESDLFSEQLAGRCAAARRHFGLRDDEPFEWRMGVVSRAAEEVEEAIAACCPGRVWIQIVNTPDECVIGGAADAVEALVQRLGCDLHRLPAVSTVHCPVVAEVEREYREFHDLETASVPDCRFYSSARGGAYAPDRRTAAEAITKQALERIDFPRLIESAWEDGVRVFVEVGPGSSCSRMIRRILEGRPHLAASFDTGGGEGRGLLRLLGRLAAAGVPVDLEPLYGSGGAPPRDTSERRHALELRVGREAPREPDLALQSPQVEPPGAEPGVRRPAKASGREAGHGGAAETAGAAVRVETVAPVLDRDQCLEFAVGSIAAVLGERFAEVDGFPTRVRLPDEPLMLVDRVVELEGEARSLGSGRIVTEHDVRPGAWYLDGGRIPTSIAVESGQADLMLSGYLGIDFQTRGDAVYRLLDAVVTFHDALPEPGRTIRYDIRIERFFRQGATWLFRFRFDGSVDGRPFLTMRDGCAGFFTERELESGRGIVRSGKLRERLGEVARQEGTSTPGSLVPVESLALDEQALDALRDGRLEAAFGGSFAGLAVERALTLPAGRLRLVHRVTELDPTGGSWGLGSIRAEADIDPEDWFITCHFVDDQVMPGTLMYECCLQTLRVLLLRSGWIAEEGEASWQPVPGVQSRLRCRGQVLASTRTVTYEVEVKRIGYGSPEQPADGEPWAIVDALMYADGKPIVEITDMSIRLVGTDRRRLEKLWQAEGSVEAGADEPTAGPTSRPALYDRDRILSFSTGNPSEAFGEPYRVFDRERQIARLPRPPYQFLDRITAVEGEPFVHAAGARCEAQVAVAPDDWYFESNRQRHIPFAVLLEMALQPCGWLAAYCGSALTSDVDLRFRNLGGEATLHVPVVAQQDLITTRVELTRVSSSAGMIIQHYRFDQWSRELGRCYSGTTYFGFFSTEALARQVGMRDAQRWQTGDPASHRVELPRDAPFPDSRLRMVDRVESWLPDGGSEQLGFLRGRIDVDPDAWFFDAHFYQDPVWPGSLGLEGFLQLAKLAAWERWGGEQLLAPVPDTTHAWEYRGQVVPGAGEVEVDCTVVARDDESRQLTADGLLAVDGRVIYAMRAFTVSADGEGGRW